MELIAIIILTIVNLVLTLFNFNFTKQITEEVEKYSEEIKSDNEKFFKILDESIEGNK